MSERTDLAPTLALALASSGSGLLAQPAPPGRGPPVHARCTGSHAAMSDRDTTCPPVLLSSRNCPKSQSCIATPIRSLAWAVQVHPLDGKACLRTQSASPATAAHLYACNSLPFERLEKHWDEAKALIVTQKNTSG